MAADETIEKTNSQPEEGNEFEKLLERFDYNFKKGNIVKGEVVGFESDRTLVDIGAKAAAIVPLKELSSDYSKSPKDVVNVGDKKEFLIIKEEDEDCHLTLSLKKVAAMYAWKEIEKCKEEDCVIEGKVLSIVKGGALVDVMGLRGFIPLSHLRTRDAESLVGETIPLKILSVDQQQNNLILSHRKVVSELQVEQRKDLFEKLEEGQIVEGEVVRLADFGAFIDIGGVDGLLPLSQMSWRWVDHPADLLSVGEKIKVQVIGIDYDKQRVSLSLKSMQPDPWTEAANVIKEGEKVSGKVIRVKPFGAFVEVYPNVEALLPHREVLEYQNKTGNLLDSGMEIEATVVRFNAEDRRISLSVSGNNPEGSEEFKAE